jgi:hypothetical protein
MSNYQDTSTSLVREVFRLDSILTVFDLSVLPEFAAVILTVIAGLGAGALFMLTAMILRDFLGGRLDWLDEKHSLENWLRPPTSLAVGNT